MPAHDHRCEGISRRRWRACDSRIRGPSRSTRGRTPNGRSSDRRDPCHSGCAQCRVQPDLDELAASFERERPGVSVAAAVGHAAG